MSAQRYRYAERELMADDFAYFVRLAKGDPWAAGDFLVERFPETQYKAAKTNTALYSALERFAANAEQCTGERLAVSTLRQYRATALAYEHDKRLSSATWSAHAQLRGRPDRHEALERYVKRAEKAGRKMLTDKLVKLYRDEDKPPSQRTARTWQEQVKAGVGNACKRIVLGGVKPADDEHWWTSVDKDTRRELAQTLEALAATIRT